MRLIRRQAEQQAATSETAQEIANTVAELKDAAFPSVSHEGAPTSPGGLPILTAKPPYDRLIGIGREAFHSPATCFGPGCVIDRDTFGANAAENVGVDAAFALDFGVDWSADIEQDRRQSHRVVTASLSLSGAA